MNNLAMLYKKTGKTKAAEALYLKELKLSEKLVGPDHPDLCVPLNNLAMFYESQQDYKKAEEYSARAIRILEAAYGPNHAQVVEAKRKYALMKARRTS
jgi:Flp pilus assembly protein TadD